MVWIVLRTGSVDCSMQTLDIHDICAVPSLLLESDDLFVLSKLLHFIEVLYLRQYEMQVQSYLSIFLFSIFYSLI